MSRAAGFCVIASLVTGFCVHGQIKEPQYSDATIILVDSVGGERPISGLFEIYGENGRIYRETIKSEAKVRLPYGEYHIIFHEQSAAFHDSRDVMIDQPQSVIVVAQTPERRGATFCCIEYINPPPLPPISLTVRVQPLTTCIEGGSLWAKLTGVYSDYWAERKVSSDGKVVFEEAEGGLYMLMIMDGQKLRATKLITKQARADVADVKLDDCK